MEEQGKFFDIETLWGKKLDLQHWRECGRQAILARVEGVREADKRQWYIGEWLLAGRKSLGVRKLRPEATKITGYPWGTLKNYMGMAKEFPKSRRRDNLRYSHHYEVRKLSQDDQKKYLDLCSKHRMPVKNLRSTIRQDKKTGEEGQRREAWLENRGPWAPLATFKFTRPNSAGLDRLYTTEKQVHGQKDIENFVIWLLTIGMANANWETDKGKEIAEMLKKGLEKQALRRSQAGTGIVKMNS